MEPTIDTIVEEMLTTIQEKTGRYPAPDCDLSVRLYAAAAQIYGLYVQSEWILRQTFPQTASGEYLDFHAQLRGLSRKDPVSATGSLVFSLEQPSSTERIIPQGTVCMTAGLVRMETTQEGIIPPQQLQIEVPARAILPGKEGNVAAHTVTAMAIPPVGVLRCHNPQAFGGGSDGEEDASLRQRILATFLRLPNGANPAFYEQGALSFDAVAAASVIPRSRGIGTVDVIVSTLSGAPDSALLEDLQKYFQSRREIAVDVQVLSPKLVPVDLSLQIRAKEGHSFSKLSPLVEQTIRQWFSGHLLGRDLLLAQLGHLVFSCDGVENYVIRSPAADLSIQKDQLPVLQSLHLEVMP